MFTRRAFILIALYARGMWFHQRFSCWWFVVLHYLVPRVFAGRCVSYLQEVYFQTSNMKSSLGVIMHRCPEAPLSHEFDPLRA